MNESLLRLLFGVNNAVFVNCLVSTELAVSMNCDVKLRIHVKLPVLLCSL